MQLITFLYFRSELYFDFRKIKITLAIKQTLYSNYKTENVFKIIGLLFLSLFIGQKLKIYAKVRSGRNL